MAALIPFVTSRATDDGATDLLVGGGGRDWFLAKTTGPNADLVALDANDVLDGV